MPRIVLRFTTSLGSSRLRQLASSLALVWCAAGCSLFDDVDHFKLAPSKKDAGPNKGGGQAGAGKSDADAGKSDAGAGNDGGDPNATDGCRNPRTLCVRLKSFTPHIDQLVGLDLVSPDHILRARAQVQGLPNDGTTDIILPRTIPSNEVPKDGDPSPLHLEIFGDQNDNGSYDADGTDHDWNNVELPGDGKLVYAHNQGFSRLLPRPTGVGGDFHIRLRDMPHVGKLFELMVIEFSTGATVGMSRLRAIPDKDFEITIPGIIDVGGVVYKIEFYADANGNGHYDDPPEDHTWTRTGESSDKGFELEFVHGTDFTPLEYQFTFSPP